ncbi:MAG: hypothetical protein OHK0015_47620 [Chloroflexi bacterium OHK40]
MSFGILTIQHVDGRREPLTIDKPIVRIGRDRANDVVLGGADVEGFHAEILADPTGLQILDLGSANGTEVDGRRIRDLPEPLQAGSVIRIGGARIIVALGGEAQPAPVGVSGPAPDAGLLADLLGRQPTAGPPRQETQPLPAAPPPPPVSLSVAVRPGELNVDPGKSVAAAVEVINRGPLEERVRLSVEGPAEWAAVLPDELTLAPGERGEAQLLFSPPRASESRAGTRQFELVARAERAPEARFSAVGQLRVAAFTEFRFELLDPRARTGWTGGRYLAQIRNGGNLPLPFTLTGIDEAGAFRFRFRPEPLLVEPGEARRSEVRASLRLRRLLGQPQTYAFTVTAAPADDSAPAQQAEGRFVQRPPVAPWLLTAFVWLLLITTLLACLGFALPRAVVAVRGAWPTARPTGTPTPSPVTAVPTASPSPTPTEEILPTIESLYTPEPVVIVPTVVVNIPPAPPPPQPIIVPPVTVPVVTTPAPLPPDRVVEFSKLNGNDVSGRTPIRGDEFIGQDMAFCIYREIPLPAPPGPGPRPNDPPQTVDGLSLAISDSPDPVMAGAPLNITVNITNTLAGRVFYGLALTLRPPAGAAVSPPGDARCVVQPDGSVICNYPDLGGDDVEGAFFTLTPSQPGTAATEVELTALAGDDASAPARTLTLRARAQTEVLSPPPPLADCGAQNTQILKDSLALRSPQSFLLQVPPVLYPPPAGALQVPLHSLTSDTGPDQFAGDAIAAISFQRAVVEVSVTVYFPGPTNNFVQLYGVDEQGKLIATFRTDRLTVPGLYQLTLRGVERPVRQVLVQNATNEGPGPVAISSGGIFITRVEVNYTAR